MNNKDITLDFLYFALWSIILKKKKFEKAINTKKE